LWEVKAFPAFFNSRGGMKPGLFLSAGTGVKTGPFLATGAAGVKKGFFLAAIGGIRPPLFLPSGCGVKPAALAPRSPFFGEVEEVLSAFSKYLASSLWRQVSPSPKSFKILITSGQSCSVAAFQNLGVLYQGELY
jgi:hypothetical protein